LIILLTNTSSNTAIIADLGIELPAQASFDLRPKYSDEQMINSVGLPAAMEAGTFSLTVDGASTSFTQLIAILTYLNKAAHEALPTLKHSISQPSFYSVTRDSKGLITAITGYTDSTMVQKVREEIYARVANSITITTITTHQYDASGNLVVTEVDYPARDGNNRVVSYSAATS
jgi:hypothetical protein